MESEKRSGVGIELVGRQFFRALRDQGPGQALWVVTPSFEAAFDLAFYFTSFLAGDEETDESRLLLATTTVFWRSLGRWRQSARFLPADDRMEGRMASAGTRDTTVFVVGESFDGMQAVRIARQAEELGATVLGFRARR